MDIQKCIDKANRLGNEVWLAGPASEESIVTLEKMMGVKLPESFRSFLLKYGAMGIYDSYIAGVTDEDPLKIQMGWVYGHTMIMRENYKDQYEVPNYLWVLEPHEDGAYCFNVNIKTDGDEIGIVNYEPYLAESTFSEVLARSFPEYLEKWYFPSYIEESDV